MSASSESLPLLAVFQADQPLFMTAAGPISQADFLAQAAALSRRLPAAGHLINLCNDRYLFALAFAAALMRGAVSLFPPNRLAATCHEIAQDYPNAVCLTDSPVEGLTLPTQQITMPPAAAAQPMPFIEPEREAFIAFTSGSTGRPQPQPKHWGDLVGCARAGARRFGFGVNHGIVATVPPQHMYGLELSILLPFTSGARVAASRPFFPADVRAELARSATPRVLVTTPVHLAACVEANLDWPQVEQVISATAPLSAELAQSVEALLSTQVREVYGSTESGSIASRDTCRDPVWRWYDSVCAHRNGNSNGVSVTADFIRGRVPLADLLEFTPDGGFRLLGRAAEMIKVAGKRASLADLNLKLNAIDGVRDGVFVAPEADGGQVGRLTVVAVAPGLDHRAIIAGLAGCIDPVFYPRRTLLVERLPYNEAGKLPREALLRLLQDHSAQ